MIQSEITNSHHKSKNSINVHGSWLMATGCWMLDDYSSRDACSAVFGFCVLFFVLQLQLFALRNPVSRTQFKFQIVVQRWSSNK